MCAPWGRSSRRCLAFLSFGLAASATYIFNDLLDLEADRHHPRKRSRPFAAGDLSPIAGAVTILLFLALSLALALLLPRVLTALSPQFPWNGQGSFWSGWCSTPSPPPPTRCA